MDDRVGVRQRRQRGWYWVSNIMHDEYGQRIGCAGLAVYSALCRRADNDSGAAYVSHRRLCLDAGIKSKTTLKKVLGELRTWGLIEINERFVDGSQRCNEYVVLDPPVPPHQNLAPPQNLVGGQPADIPAPGTNPEPGPGTKTGHFKKDSFVKDSVVKGDRRSTKELMSIAMRIIDLDRDGWSLKEMLELGKLDPEEWSEAKRSSMVRAQLKRAGIKGV